MALKRVHSNLQTMQENIITRMAIDCAYLRKILGCIVWTSHFTIGIIVILKSKQTQFYDFDGWIRYNSVVSRFDRMYSSYLPLFRRTYVTFNINISIVVTHVCNFMDSSSKKVEFLSIHEMFTLQNSGKTIVFAISTWLEFFCWIFSVIK